MSLKEVAERAEAAGKDLVYTICEQYGSGDVVEPSDPYAAVFNAFLAATPRHPAVVRALDASLRRILARVHPYPGTLGDAFAIAGPLSPEILAWKREPTALALQESGLSYQAAMQGDGAVGGWIRFHDDDHTGRYVAHKFASQRAKERSGSYYLTAKEVYRRRESELDEPCGTKLSPPNTKR